MCPMSTSPIDALLPMAQELMVEIDELLSLAQEQPDGLTPPISDSLGSASASAGRSDVIESELDMVALLELHLVLLREQSLFWKPLN